MSKRNSITALQRTWLLALRNHEIKKCGEYEELTVSRDFFRHINDYRLQSYHHKLIDQLIEWKWLAPAGGIGDNRFLKLTNAARGHLDMINQNAAIHSYVVSNRSFAS